MGYPGNPVVTGTLSLAASSDTYATHWDILGKGGIHAVADLTARNAITTVRRSWGMLCVVYADGTAGNNKTYQLKNTILGGTNDTITDNSNWVEFTSGSGSGHIIQNAGTGLTQRATLNILNGLTASDNSGATKTEIKLGGALTANTTLSGSFDLYLTNNGLSIGNTSLQASSLLELTSTTKALLLPRIVTEGGITTPLSGHIYYNSTLADLRGRINSQWVSLTRPEIVIDNASTTLTLTEADRNKIYFLGAATDIAVSAGDISVGFMVTLFKTGTGNVLFSPTGGTSLDAISDTISIANSGATFVQKSSTKWQGSGALGDSLGLTDGNGTTANGTAVDLGGTLTGDATITGVSYTLTILPYDFVVSVDNDVNITASNEINLNATDTEITGTGTLTLISDNQVGITLGSDTLVVTPDSWAIHTNGSFYAGTASANSYLQYNLHELFFQANGGTYTFGVNSAGDHAVSYLMNSGYGIFKESKIETMSQSYAFAIGTPGSQGIYMANSIGTAGPITGLFNNELQLVTPGSITLYVGDGFLINGIIEDPAPLYVLTYDGSEWVTFTDVNDLPGGGGGSGITNGAGSNELMKSNGTDAVASGLFSTTAGNITMGTGLTGSTRTITATGSATDVSMLLTPKGSGIILAQAAGGTGFLQIGVNKAQIGSDGDAYVDITGDVMTFNNNSSEYIFGGSTNASVVQTIKAEGSGASVGLFIQSKGAGAVMLQSGTGGDIFLDSWAGVVNFGQVASVSTTQLLQAGGSATDVSIYLKSKGNGYVGIVTPGTAGVIAYDSDDRVTVNGNPDNYIDIYGSNNTTTIWSQTIVHGAIAEVWGSYLLGGTYAITGGAGGVSQVHGIDISIVGGAAYGASGNGNGGDLILRSGTRRAAGSGADGDLTLDAKTGKLILTATPPTDASTSPVVVRDASTGELKLVTQASIGGSGGLTQAQVLARMV